MAVLMMHQLTLEARVRAPQFFALFADLGEAVALCIALVWGTSMFG